jgi:SAM-dependent methyltransferase
VRHTAIATAVIACRATAKGWRIMAGTISERVSRYILDGSDEDLRRLLIISEVLAEQTRATFRRAGIADGGSAIECGCGPLGGLAILAETVGPSGRVVGVDSSQPSIERARSVLATLELGNVEVIVGDINEMDLAAIGGPFDLAYSRQFLMHQPDRLHTLKRIAGLVRPGGWLIALEPLRSVPPHSHPRLEALESCWNLLHAVRDRTGVPTWAVEELPNTARAAGFEVVNTEGYFAILEPPVGFEIYAVLLEALRPRAIELDVESASSVDELVNTLRAARTGDYHWVASVGCLSLMLRAPTLV